MDQRIEIQVPAGLPRTRLEDFLFSHFSGLSRMYLRGAVRDGLCEVNGRDENVGFRVRGGDFIEIELDLTRENSMTPEDVPLDIIYEDEHLLVVNKPAGMLVHPTNRDKKGTLLNALSFHLNAGRVVNAECGMRFSPSSQAVTDGKSQIPVPKSQIVRPGLVHRLDKQTSGIMVIAKSVRTHRSLARQFQRKFVEKKYLAMVDGAVREPAGAIVAPIGRYGDQKRWDIKPGGKHSETRYRVKACRPDSTLLELEPVTGRTNQLRIHCASIGHPIVGDPSRGGSEFPRLCLHAWKLTFRHPVSREDLSFETPFPEFANAME